jgi:cell division protein ZapA
MGEVSLLIGGNHYTVSCRDGEEEHLRSVGSLVNSKTHEARAAVGEGLGEARQLLFAALLLADEIKELRQQSLDEDEIATFENIADRVAALSDTLVRASRKT